MSLSATGNQHFAMQELTASLVSEGKDLTSYCVFSSYLGSSAHSFSPLSEAGSSPALAAQILIALGPSCSLIQGQREERKPFLGGWTALVWRVLYCRWHWASAEPQTSVTGLCRSSLMRCVCMCVCDMWSSETHTSMAGAPLIQG